MSDDEKKEFDPEVDIKFTVDAQVREYFKQQGVIEEESSKDEDKASTIDLASQSSEEINKMSLELNENVSEEELEMDLKDISLKMEIPEDIPSAPTASPEQEIVVEENPLPKLVFFDYRSEFFAYLVKELDENLNYRIIEEFEALPRELQSGSNIVLFLNYSAYPKLCSQLIPKVKSKFPSIKIAIVAKNLTPEKVQAHQNSPEGVHEYLSFPFSRDDFFRVISQED